MELAALIKDSVALDEEYFLSALLQCDPLDPETLAEIERIRIHHSHGNIAQVEFTDGTWKDDPFYNTDYMKFVFVFAMLNRAWNLCILPGNHDECKKIYWEQLFKNYPKLWEFTALCVWG